MDQPLVFLNPPFPRRIVRRYKCSYEAQLFLFPPLDLLSLEAMAARAGAQTVVVDAVAEGLGADEVIHRLRALTPCAVLVLVGVEIIEMDLAVLAALKRGMPDVPFLITGYLPSLFPGDALRRSGCDAVLRFEAELTIVELVRSETLARDARSWGDFDGTAILAEGRVQCAPTRQRITNLATVPHPNRSKVDIRRYSAFLMPRPGTTMVTARGCPYPCLFCIRSFDGPVVFRPVDHVMAEWNEVRSLGIRSVAILDDTFFLNRDRDEELLRSMSRSPSVVWTCMTRIDRIEDDFLRLAREAGCRRISIGLESGSDEVLRSLRKGYTTERIREAFETLETSQIHSNGLIILGAPAETDDDLRRTRRLLVDSPLHFLNLTRYTKYPGTDRTDSNSIDPDEPLRPIVIADVSALVEATLYLRFYLTPRRIAVLIRYLATDPVHLVRAMFAMIRYIVTKPYHSTEHDRFL